MGELVNLLGYTQIDLHRRRGGSLLRTIQQCGVQRGLTDRILSAKDVDIPSIHQRGELRVAELSRAERNCPLVL